MLAVAFGLPLVLRLSPVRLPSFSMTGRFFGFGQPLSFVRSASMIMAFSTQYVLASLASFTQVGYFAAALMLAQRSIAMLMVTLGQTAAASVFQALEKDGPERAAAELHRHFSMLLLISAPLLSVMVFANDTVAAVIFNEAFGVGVAPHLAILAVAAFINGIQASFLAFSFSMNKETTKQLVLTICIACIHFAVTYAATSRFGAVGASCAMVGIASLNAAIYAAYGWPMVKASRPAGPLLKIAAATLVSAPLLVLADRLGAGLISIASIGAGMAVFVIVVKLLGYPSLDIILRGLWRAAAGGTRGAAR